MKMKKNIVTYLLLFSLLLFGGLALGPSSMYGMENAVQTNGEIIFYEETKESTEVSKPQPTSSQPKESTPDKSVAKPVGRFPSTGELVKKSLLFSGSLVLLFGLFLCWTKRKKSVSEKGD
ncbi:LPXTG cell wall anchor domain-containing protein [Enterococcus sp. LJL99]